MCKAQEGEIFMQGKDFKERDCMSFDGFCISVRIDIQRRLGDSFLVYLNDVTKNNDTKLKALVITEQGTNLHPNIYMEGFYDRYRDGDSLVEIEEAILLVYQKSRMGKRFDASLFTNWKKVKERIIFRLVNFDRNRELLSDIPHRKFLDLAIVYECFLGVNDGGGASILIHNSHLDLWKVTEDELHTTAFRNTPELMGCSFLNMKEVLQKLMDSEGEKELLEGLWGVEEANDNRFPMYVLTNRYKIHGNGCILYKNLLKKISEEWGCDICIIPSSVHETILMPMDKVESYGEMAQMICEANRTAVMPDEILSDHPYLFVRETGKITMQEGMDYE